MIAHSAWIRWGVLAAAMTFLAAGSGCGGGGGGGVYYGPSGTLEVENYVLSTDVVQAIVEESLCQQRRKRADGVHRRRPQRLRRENQLLVKLGHGGLAE